MTISSYIIIFSKEIAKLIIMISSVISAAKHIFSKKIIVHLKNFCLRFHFNLITH